jgi:YfiH family protein
MLSGMSDPIALRSHVLGRAGFVAAFSMRSGGVSEGPFASLNLGRAVGDEPAHVEENHRRLADCVGYDPTRLFESSQVHGHDVIDVPSRDDADPCALRARKADALVARRHGDAVGVRTADCVPVLLADCEAGAVAAVHAGWRGVVAGVVASSIQVLGARDVRSVVAAIGPSIGPCCFEVGDEVAQQFVGLGAAANVLRDGGRKPRVDLWAVVEKQLRSAGIDRIEVIGECTVCEADRYFSFRRDGARSGRMLSVVTARRSATAGSVS